MYEKVAIITQIRHRAKYYFTCVINTVMESDYCTKYEQNHYILLLMYEQIAIITQIWPKTLVINMTKIHPATTEECARIDRGTDRQKD